MMNNSNNNPSPYPHHSHPPHPHSSQTLTYYAPPIDNLSYTFPQRPSSHQNHVQQNHQQSSQQTSHGLIQTQRTTSSGRTDTGAWPCLLDGCNKVFAREADLKRHQRTTKSHSIPGSSVANPCPLCEATFTRSDAMRRHLKSRHQGKTPETLNLPADAASGGPSSSISSGASSSRGANRRAYSPSEETSELSASDSERQPYHHHSHNHGHGHHHQTSSSSAAAASGQHQQTYSSSSRGGTSSSSYYSSPPLSPTSPTSTSSSSNPASAGSSHHGIHHHHHHHQDASNLSPHVLYQAANNTMSYEIQHALSSPRQSHPSHHHQQQQQHHQQHQHQHQHSAPPNAPSSSSSSSSSRRDTTTSPTSSYGMHPQQAVTMPMQPHSHTTSYPPYTNPPEQQQQQQQYPAYQQSSYPAYTSSSNGYPSAGGNGSNSVYHGNPYIGTANRAASGHGGGGGGNNYTMMSPGGGGSVPQTWGGKLEEGMMDGGRGAGGMSPTRQQPSTAGGLATLAMQASRVRPMSPLGPGKPKSSTKSELENALGPAGVYRR